MSDDTMPPASGETNQQRFARELIEILNELRIAIPGVQMLFAFLLMVPFAPRFTELTRAERLVFFVGFLATALAAALLTAPSVYHRLHWRREIAAKERMLQAFSTFAVSGAFFLAVAMVCVIYVITAFLFPGPTAGVTTGLSGLVFFLLWFIVPVSGRRRLRRQRPIGSDGDRFG